VWEKAGYANKAAKSTDPAQFSYDECPRALQFRRLHKDVKTDADMGWIIGYAPFFTFCSLLCLLSEGEAAFGCETAFVWNCQLEIGVANDICVTSPRQLE
jgi:hypothetical protein